MSLKNCQSNQKIFGGGKISSKHTSGSLPETLSEIRNHMSNFNILSADISNYTQFEVLSLYPLILNLLL